MSAWRGDCEHLTAGLRHEVEVEQIKPDAQQVTVRSNSSACSPRCCLLDGFLPSLPGP